MPVTEAKLKELKSTMCNSEEYLMAVKSADLSALQQSELLCAAVTRADLRPVAHCFIEWGFFPGSRVNNPLLVAHPSNWELIAQRFPATVKQDNSLALRYAVRFATSLADSKGKARFLLERGADVNAFDEEPGDDSRFPVLVIVLSRALVSDGHIPSVIDMMDFLADYKVNIHAENDYALKVALTKINSYPQLLLKVLSLFEPANRTLEYVSPHVQTEQGRPLSPSLQAGIQRCLSLAQQLKQPYRLIPNVTTLGLSHDLGEDPALLDQQVITRYLHMSLVQPFMDGRFPCLPDEIWRHIFSFMEPARVRSEIQLYRLEGIVNYCFSRSAKDPRSVLQPIRAFFNHPAVPAILSRDLPAWSYTSNPLERLASLFPRLHTHLLASQLIPADNLQTSDHVLARLLRTLAKIFDCLVRNRSCSLKVRLLQEALKSFKCASISSAPELVECVKISLVCLRRLEGMAPACSKETGVFEYTAPH